MHLSMSGNFAGQPRTLEIRTTDNKELQLVINWRDRNAGNDGDEIYSQSIVVDRAELKKAVDML